MQRKTAIRRHDITRAAENASHPVSKPRAIGERPELGAKLKVCGWSTTGYDYSPTDLYDFVDVPPSVLIELLHEQNQGYELISATVMSKKFSIEDIYDIFDI